MLCVRKLTPGTEISWARDAQPERVQKCVAEGEAESTPCQLEATAPCSVASTKTGVHPVASHVMELPLCGEPLWLFMAPRIWSHESGNTNLATRIWSWRTHSPITPAENLPWWSSGWDLVLSHAMGSSVHQALCQALWSPRCSQHLPALQEHMSCKKVGPGNAHLVLRVRKTASGSMTYCAAFSKSFSPSGVSFVT